MDGFASMTKVVALSSSPTLVAPSTARIGTPFQAEWGAEDLVGCWSGRLVVLDRLNDSTTSSGYT
jgi:hypothetical protein